MNKIDNKLSTEQLDKMSIQEILVFNGFKKVNNELVRLEDTKGDILSLATCTPLTLVTTAAFTVGIPVGPSSATVGTTSLTYTVLVTNTGGTAGGTQVTLYEGIAGTVISSPATSTIQPGLTQTLTFIVNVSSWAAGNYTICSRVGP